MSVKASGVSIETPKVPNYVFIKGTDSKAKIPITMLSDEDIESLAIAWGMALRARRIQIENETLKKENPHA